MSIRSHTVRLIPFATATVLCSVSLSAQAYEDECKPPKTSYESVYCTSEPDYFLANNDNSEPVALLNKQGKAVVNLRGYEAIDTWGFSDGVFAVLKNNKVGYMNTQGKLVVPTIYDSLMDPNDKYDETWAEAPSQNRIMVAKNGKYGIIDTSNNVIMPFTNKYDFIGSFKEGMAPILASNKWGFIDINGKEVIPPKYDDTAGSFGGPYGFSQGLAGMKKGNKWGYITKTGKVAVPFIYDEIRPFYEELAGVRKGNKWGFINGANKTIIPFKYSDENVERYSVNFMGATYFIFRDGIAEVATINDKMVCINKSGREVDCY